MRYFLLFLISFSAVAGLFQNLRYNGSCELNFTVEEVKQQIFMDKNADFYKKYYDVILQVGSELKPGDKVLIGGNHADLRMSSVDGGSYIGFEFYKPFS